MNQPTERQGINEHLHLLRAAVEQSFNAVVITDADLIEGPRIIYANPAFERQTGYPWAELEGNTPRILQGPATDRDLLNRLRRTLQAGKPFQGQTTNYRRNGTPYQVHWYISPVRDPETGAITHFVSIQRDVTEAERNNQQLRLLSTALEESAEQVMITDADGRITYVNRAFELKTGYGRSEAIGENPRMLQSGFQGADFYNELWETIGAKEVFRATFIDQARDGSLFYLEQSITPVLGSDGSITHYVSEGKDITERVRRERELKRVATTDWLTGLANRGRFEYLLDKEFERGRRYDHELVLVMFDVDYFKDVNDRYGHEIGDEILKVMAGAVDRVLRDTDDLGRWGGEEFMILAPETGTEGGRILAERIREVIADTEFPGPGHITASFGVTTRKPDDTPRDITRRVDDALYEAKKKGRNLTEIA